MMEPMKLALQFTAAGLSILALASCGSSGMASNSGPSGTGPFDSRGNYVEDWADNPSKWKRNSASPAKPGEALVMTTITDEPPPNSVPLPTAADTPEPGDIGSAPVIVRNTQTRSSASKPVSAPRTTSRTSTASSSNAARSTTQAKAKPKATASKTPAKKKVTTTRYTIKRGDTLSSIASRHGTTVSALRSANGITGSVIHPGKTLVISKR